MNGVESVGIDEAYVDLTGIPINNKFPHSKQFSTAGLIADNVRNRVKSELEIAVSVCIAETKTTAKDMEKLESINCLAQTLISFNSP